LDTIKSKYKLSKAVQDSLEKLTLWQKKRY
jgi:hypothetical protein